MWLIISYENFSKKIIHICGAHARALATWKCGTTPPISNGGIYDVIKWRHLIRFWKKLQEIFIFIILGGGANMKSFAPFKQKLWPNLLFLGQHIGEIYRKWRHMTLKCRHYVRFSQKFQEMFSFTILCCGANIKSFA